MRSSMLAFQGSSAAGRSWGPSSYRREAEAIVTSTRMSPTAHLPEVPSPQAPKPAVAALAPQQIVEELKGGGMPIKAIAEAARVERKTIYSWLDGSAARGDNTRRLEAIHKLMTGRQGFSIGDVFRFWHSSLAGAATLRDLLTAEALDEQSIRDFLDRLRLPTPTDDQKRKMAARAQEPNPVTNEMAEAVPLWEHQP